MNEMFWNRTAGETMEKTSPQPAPWLQTPPPSFSQISRIPIVEKKIDRREGLPAWKRILDVAMIAALLPAVLFFGLIIALVVKFGSRGPVFFRQRRVGYKGQEFMLLKFRTMQARAETASHQEHTRQLMKSETPMQKLDAKNDPRLVPMGSILRATGLDELPQLINVLKGEMSIVGPRPCTTYEYVHYSPEARCRFDAVPGLTGLWQVSGKNRTTFNEMIQLDVRYARKKSIWLDTYIIFKTLPALVMQCMDMAAVRRSNNSENSPSQKLAKSVSTQNI